MSSFDGSQQIISSIIDAIDEIGIALRVGCPQDNDLIEAILELELAVIESALGVLGRGRLTICLDGSASHGLARPWIP